MVDPVPLEAEVLLITEALPAMVVVVPSMTMNETRGDVLTVKCGELRSGLSGMDHMVLE